MLGYGFVMVAFTTYVLYPALPFFIILFTPQRFLRIVTAILAISLLFLLFKTHTPDCDEITGGNVFAFPQLSDIGFWFFSVTSLIFGLSTRFVWLLRNDKIVFKISVSVLGFFLLLSLPLFLQKVENIIGVNSPFCTQS